MFCFAMLALSLLLASGAVAQRQFFIDSETGVDSPACGEVGSPCRTISHADVLAVNESGDAIFQLSGTHVFVNDSFLLNSGGWNQLIGDPINPENVVIDGRENSTRLLEWTYSDNNQTGPFYFNGITFTGFTDETISLQGQHLDVRNCIFDSRGQRGSLAMEARLQSSSDVAEEAMGSNSSTIYAENVVTYNAVGSRGSSINCNRCYNITLLNCLFVNGSDTDTKGMFAVRIRAAIAAYIENVTIVDTYSCGAGALLFDGIGSAVVRNIDIRGVYPIGSGCGTDRTGAIYMEDSTGTIEFDGVHVSNSTSTVGSAMHIFQSSRVIVRNCHFENNTATQMGTFYVNSLLDDDFALEVYDCVLENNEALMSGGGFEFDGRIAPTTVTMERVDITNNRVTDEGGVGGAINVPGSLWSITYRGGSMVNNYADFGGAVFFASSEGTALHVQDVMIVNNTAGSDGGAMYLGGEVETLVNVTFRGNQAGDSGGCLYATKGIGAATDIQVLGCSFSRCVAGESGGAIFVDGGSLRINDSVIVDSVAGNGGAVFHGGRGFLEINTTTIAGNNAGGEGLCAGQYGLGGGVYFQDEACAMTLFTDVDFEGNVANLSGGAYHTENTFCGDSWCSSCEFTDNDAAGSGATRSASFLSFRAAEGTANLPVTLGEQFFLTVVPYDEFDGAMGGNHELLPATIEQPSSPELLVCGDLRATASRGRASFALTTFLVDSSETAIRDQVTSGQDASVSLYLERSSNRESFDGRTELPLQIVGCPDGFELDQIPSDEVEDAVRECMGRFFSDDMTIPRVMRCYIVTTLSDGEQKAVLTIAILMLFFGLILAFVAIYFRRNRVVWCASWLMMTVSVIGSLALLSASVLRAYRATTLAMCMSYEWLLILGLNLLMGASFAKNLRVWKIFTMKTLRVVKISNWLLLFGILVASIPDIITLTIQTTAFPLTVDTTLGQSVCFSRTEKTFRSLYGLYKALWMLAGLGTAYLVRNVPEKFNELKSVIVHVALTLLTVVIIWGIGNIVDVRSRTIIESLTISIVALAYLCEVFVPKFFTIYKGRDATLMSSTANGTQTQQTFTTFGADSNTGEKKGQDGEKAELQDRFRQLKEVLNRTQKLYERSFENTQELREKYRNVESDMIALQFEVDFRVDVNGAKISEPSGSSEDNGSRGFSKVASPPRDA